MGACASRPKDLDVDARPEPLPEPVDNAIVEKKAEETNTEGEATKEEPLVDLSEPKEEAANATEEEPKTAEVELLSVEEPKEAEETKAEEEAAKEVEEVAAENDKSDEPLVTV